MDGRKERKEAFTAVAAMVTKGWRVTVAVAVVVVVLLLFTCVCVRVQLSCEVRF